MRSDVPGLASLSPFLSSSWRRAIRSALLPVCDIPFSARSFLSSGTLSDEYSAMVRAWRIDVAKFVEDSELEGADVTGTVAIVAMLRG